MPLPPISLQFLLLLTSLAPTPPPHTRSVQTLSTLFTTMRTPTQVFERVEQAFSCGRMLCAGFHAAGLPQHFRCVHIIIRTFLRWLLLVSLLHYDGRRCGALPVKRAPSRLIPLSQFPRRFLRPHCLFNHPIRRFPTFPASPSCGSNERAVCLRFSCIFVVTRYSSPF